MVNRQASQVRRGGLSTDALQQELASAVPSMEHCYRDAPQGVRERGGQLDARVLIGDDGRVRRVRPPQGTVRHGPVRSCLVRTLRELRFPVGEAPSRARVSFVFRAD